ncbi:hypothetical protein sS8_0161 [Methylocaldum marinum]|uniref:Uncharacterized protein n=1 Tax=Methylocaldum marinum TaxID=1432792 RepID=A0A286P3A7_9GAMM|nr:hypothetical protein [Methylocaldum marinum]BBA32129.1 hypothetical protein sS8_0161 [Methylocaldum marinum]
MTNPALRAAVRDYTRAFLNTYRRGTSSLRKVLPIDLQFDRFAEVERFRRETWQQLHDLARGNAAVARAIDEGPIGEALGVHTTHDARTALSRVELEPLASFVIGHLQPDGSISVTKEEIESTFVSVGTTMTSLTFCRRASNTLIRQNEFSGSRWRLRFG